MLPIVMAPAPWGGPIGGLRAATPNAIRGGGIDVSTPGSMNGGGFREDPPATEVEGTARAHINVLNTFCSFAAGSSAAGAGGDMDSRGGSTFGNGGSGGGRDMSGSTGGTVDGGFVFG